MPPSPPQSQPAKPRGRLATIAGWVGGCLVALLVVVALLITALVYGLLHHQLVWFFIGLGGLVLIILVGVAIEHFIRRLYRSAVRGIERLERPGYIGEEAQGIAYPRRRQEQPQFSLFRFVLTLALLAGVLYGGLYLYYTQVFAGEWVGIVSIANVRQGVLTHLPLSLSLQRPTHLSLSDLGAIDATQVHFKQEAASVCNKDGSRISYQLSGTASRLDVSMVTMTLNTGTERVSLHGSFKQGMFSLAGTTSKGKPVTLTLKQGSTADFARTCQQLG